jgi:hypothetical protein
MEVDSDILPRLLAAIVRFLKGGDCLMGGVELLRSKAEECLEKARLIGDRQRARFLLVQAHNYLKYAEETEAQQLSARHVNYREG